MINKDSPDRIDGSTDEALGEAGLRTLRKLRDEAAKYRVALRRCEEKRPPALTVLAWRPSSSGSTVVGMADVALGDLTIFDVRLVRLGGGFALSWPARKPIGGSGLQPIMRPTPALDGRALAAVLETAFPPTTVVLPQ